MKGTQIYLLDLVFIQVIEYLPELLSIHVANLCILLRLLTECKCRSDSQK